VAGRTATTGGTVGNTYKVNDDESETVTVNVPDLAGSSNVTVNKNWDNYQDPYRNDTVSRMILYYKVGNGDWARYQKNGQDYIIEMNGGYDQQVNFTDLPAYEYNNSTQTRTPIYYKVEEEVVTPSGVDDLYNKEFISGNEGGAKASSNPYFNIRNTWEGTSVTGIKQWRDDEGLEANRQDAILTLQKYVNGNWVDVDSKNAGTGNYSSVTWPSLPKYDENHNEIQYRVIEKSVQANYTAQQSGNTITNVYNNMTVSAEKNWARVDSDEDKPEYVKFKVMRTIDPNDDSSWEDVAGTEKILNKEDYANSADVLKWPDLPKNDGQGHNYYYKVVEIQETPDQQEFDVSYNNNSIQASDWSHKANITNTWKKTNISFSKQWMDDNGNERYRPNLIFALQKSVDNGEWTTIETVKMVNDGTGLYKPQDSADEGSSNISYTWRELEAADNIRYRVVETDLLALKRSTTQVGVEDTDPVTGENIKDTGYDVYYNYPDSNNTEPPSLMSTGSTDARNVNVINKSNMITIRVNKNWNGVYGDSRPDRVGYRLYQWTDDQYNTLSEEEKYTDTYKFSDKYALKNSAGESDVINWTWMQVKDENGDPYHYGLREIYIGKRTNSGDEAAIFSDNSVYYNDYEIEITEDTQGDSLKVFSVTNTWKKMNVSIRKNWEDGSNESGYKSITMKLMQKVGANGTWEEVPGAEIKTITAAGGWQLEDAWTDLPRTDNDGYNIYYRAEEVSATKTNDAVVAVEESEDFYTRPDANGINSSGESVVANTPKKIRVDAVKHWVSTRGTAKPDSIVFTLMASYNGGATWVKADQLTGYNIYAKKTLTLDSNDLNADLTTYWENLPTKYVVDSMERDVIYKVEENEVTGYSVSYDKEFVSTNSTINVTNTENAPYTKKAANYSPNEMQPGQDKYQVPTLISTNDDPLVENTLSSEELSSVSTKMVNINGEEVECYLFKWRVDLLTNQNKNIQDALQDYSFTDTLTDGSVFYNDYNEYAVTFYDNAQDNNPYFAYVLSEDILQKIEDGTITENEWNNAVSRYNDTISFEYSDSMTSATFNAKKRVARFSYYTATPKSVVDDAVEQNGRFIISNYIKEENENTPHQVDMNISGGDDLGTIDKINRSSSGTTSSGKAIMQNGIAHYTLDVNKDSKYLSAGDTVSVTDIFRILKYTPNGGEEQVGRAIQLEPSLENVSVYYYDVDGRRSRVDADQYSYSVTKDPNGVMEKEEDYSSKFTNANLSIGYGTVIEPVGYDVPKGLEVVIRVPGTPGAVASLDNATYGNAVNVPAGIKATLLSDTFDSSGHVDVLLKFTQDFPAKQRIGELRVKNQYVDDSHTNAERAATVVSAVLKSRTETTDYITKFTLPDGGHYEIMYDYVIKNPDGSDIPNDSSISLYNQATVHTSGGDKSDESQETEYMVSKSGAQTHVGENFKVTKIDLGNRSLKDLNAEFKLAKFDEDLGQWIYADDFTFKLHELANGYSYYDETLHEASFVQGLTETDGLIPDASANMVLSGSFEVDVAENTLYKLIEVKAPDNHDGYKYPKVPYEQNPPDKRVVGNEDNTYYFVYDTEDSTKTALAAAAGLDNSIEVKSIQNGDAELIIPNVRKIDIGASKTWAQDPDSAANDVQVAVRLLRSPNKDRADAVPVENQGEYIISPANRVNYVENFTEGIGGSGIEVYILQKADAWTKDVIWEDLPNSDINTQQPYYYFVEEVAYKIGNTWYVPGEDGADYKPSYTDDAINSSGVIGIVNSSKLVVRKQWEDKNGSVITDPPVSFIDFNLYGIKSDGTEVKIILPEGRQRLTAPNWEVEIPQHLITGEGMDYVRFRIEETTELEDYIVSDVYSFNGNVGVMYLINKNTNPTSVDVNLSKTWADGNDAHGTDDAVTFTLYQFAGKQTVDQAFIENFISRGKTYSGVTMVNTVPNPVVLDGTESEPWQWEWNSLPFRGGADMSKLQYFVVEEQSDSTKDSYQAIYTIDGNSSYTAVRDLDVTNKQPGVLIVKKQWRDKTQADNPLITNANYGDVTLRLYRKAANLEQIANAEATDIRTKYGLTDDDLVTGVTDVEGLNSDGTITIGKDDRWTVSLSGLEEGYLYYVEETDGTGYLVEDYDPEYSNEGQPPGSEDIITVDNFVEGERIKVKAVKNWDDSGTGVDIPDSITLILEQLNSSGGTPVTIGSKTVTAADDWTAEWTDLPASKTYQIRENVPDGWLVSYGELQITQEGDDDELEVRNYSITNTIDTGQLKVNKLWLNHDAGGTTSVNVELWRQAYDENGDPVIETAPETQSTNGRFSSGRNLTSLRKVRKALAENSSPAVQGPLRAPRVTTSALVAPNVRGSGTDTHGNYVSIDVINGTVTNLNINSNCGAYEIEEIGLVFDGDIEAVNNLQVDLDGNGVHVVGYGHLNTHTVDSNVIYLSNDWFKVNHYDPNSNTFTGIPNPLNTISIQYSVQKSGVNRSLNEIRFYYTPTVTISIDDPGDVVAGDTTTLTATDSTGTVTWSLVDSNGAPAAYDFATITSGGVLTTSGTGTIYVKAQDSASSDTRPITISPFTINGKSGISTDQTEDTSLMLSAKAPTTWESSNTNVATVNSTTGEVTFVGNGEVTITATHGGVSDTITFNVSSKAFSAEVEPEIIHNGMTANLSTDPTFTDAVTWSVKNSGDSEKVTISGNNVTANVENADVVLVASRGTASDEVTLHIRPMLVTYNGSDITPTNLTSGVNSSIPVVNVVGASSGTSTDHDVAYYDSDTHTVRTGEKVGSTEITITDAGQTLTFTVNVEVSEAESNIPATAEKVADITISADNNWWSNTLNDLPKTDGNGNTYRYFIKEESTGAYIPVSYSTAQGGTPLNDGITNLDLTNSSVQTEEVELPEAGGQGTVKIYMAGGVMMLLAAAGFVYFKRRGCGRQI